MAVLELTQHLAVPAARGVPADVGEDQRPVGVGLGDPAAARRGVVGLRRQQRHLRIEVEQHRPRPWRPADEDVRVLRLRVAVGDHRAVVVDGDRHGDRGVPVGIAPARRQVDVLLLLQGAPTEFAVVVAAERRAQAGAQPQPRGRDREVGDAAGARPHPVGPDLLTGPRQVRQAGEDDVEEDHALQEDVELRRSRRSQMRQRVEALRRERGGAGRALLLGQPAAHRSSQSARSARSMVRDLDCAPP